MYFIFITVDTGSILFLYYICGVCNQVVGFLFYFCIISVVFVIRLWVLLALRCIDVHYLSCFNLAKSQEIEFHNLQQHSYPIYVQVIFLCPIVHILRYFEILTPLWILLFDIGFSPGFFSKFSILEIKNENNNVHYEPMPFSNKVRSGLTPLST